GFPLDVWYAQLFIGLVNGCILILVALGLSIVFGLMGIINFAHGIFYMLGAYAGWLTIHLTGSFWLALLTAPLAVGLVGVLVERGVLSRIYGTKNANFAGVLVTYGLAIMIPDLVRMTFGRPGKPFAIPEALTGSLFRLGALDVHAYRVFILAVTAGLLPLLWILLNRTNLGLVIRAGTSDNLMVQLLGINVARTWTTTYALGAALAAFAGVITAPLVAVAPEMGGLVLIECFIVTVVGGMGSFLGVVAGGLLIGETLALTGMLYDVLADVVIYLAMALVLLVRPRGLFGQEGMSEE
ncbi:MAG TPA: branched-chain amino acid ABC transporter permease, partial [Methylomirabilota bacterium]